ncbi:MAG TPA: NAD-dependent epimerase/dehydratase family protein [Solirubrobacteraceae bacterium]|jgi:CDP-paratose 2-epimerase|nr:NAD-dependent epimerase/dehydratase family protein [Solirubrobacteraceae bacterium]
MSAVLITGGAGFVGTNLADHMLERGRRVRILDNLSRPGVERNLAWLERAHGSALEVMVADVRDRAAVRRALRGVESVFHFAAQVAVTTSLDEPLDDAGVNVTGTLHLLEEVRRASRPIPVVFTSTNKVYGSLPDVELTETERRYEPVGAEVRAGIAESRALSFCTPYGCSKGAADQYVLDWAHSYQVPSVVFRMSCIYGPHQQGNEDQGWVAHFVLRALDDEPITLFGDGKQVRDVLYVEDLVRALAIAETRASDFAGRAFNIGGGPGNAVSLLDVISILAAVRGEPPEIRHEPWRAGDQRYYVSDTTTFTAATGWRPEVGVADGVERLHAWLVDDDQAARAAA